MGGPVAKLSPSLPPSATSHVNDLPVTSLFSIVYVWMKRESDKDTDKECVCVCVRERERERERESKTERAYLTISTLSLTNRFRTTFARALTRNKGILFLSGLQVALSLWVVKKTSTHNKSHVLFSTFLFSLFVSGSFTQVLPWGQEEVFVEIKNIIDVGREKYETYWGLSYY